MHTTGVMRKARTKWAPMDSPVGPALKRPPPDCLRLSSCTHTITQSEKRTIDAETSCYCTMEIGLCKYVKNLSPYITCGRHSSMSAENGENQFGNCGFLYMFTIINLLADVRQTHYERIKPLESSHKLRSTVNLLLDGLYWLGDSLLFFEIHK